MGRGGTDAATASPASPLDTASPLARLTFLWLSPLLDVGAERQLRPADLPPLPAADAAAAIRKRFERQWRKYEHGTPHRLARTLAAVVQPQMVRGAIAKFIYDSLLFVGPATLRYVAAGCRRDRIALRRLRHRSAAAAGRCWTC